MPYATHKVGFYMGNILSALQKNGFYSKRWCYAVHKAGFQSNRSRFAREITVRRAGGPNGTYPERPVGAPDHSQGRNPWCVDDQGETLGGPASIHSGPGGRLVGRIQYAPTPLRSFAPMGRVSGLTPKHLNGAQPQQLNTY